MPLSEEKRRELLLATRGAAIAFLEDMQHVREVVSRADPSRGELRRLSVTLRRLLVNSEIADIAAPRVGKIELLAYDNKQIYDLERKIPIRAFVSGGFTAFGMSLRAAIITTKPFFHELDEMHPESTVSLRLDSFLSQRILCLDSRWASRRQVIKYVANLLSAAHTGTPQDEAEEHLRKISMCLSLSSKGMRLILPPQGKLPESPLKYSPDEVDPLLLELLTIANLLTISPEVQRLEAAIRQELGIAP